MLYYENRYETHETRTRTIIKPYERERTIWKSIETYHIYDNYILENEKTSMKEKIYILNPYLQYYIYLYVFVMFVQRNYVWKRKPVWCLLKTWTQHEWKAERETESLIERERTAAWNEKRKLVRERDTLECTATHENDEFQMRDFENETENLYICYMNPYENLYKRKREKKEREWTIRKVYMWNLMLYCPVLWAHIIFTSIHYCLTRYSKPYPNHGHLLLLFMPWMKSIYLPYICYCLFVHIYCFVFVIICRLLFFIVCYFTLLLLRHSLSMLLSIILRAGNEKNRQHGTQKNECRNPRKPVHAQDQQRVSSEHEWNQEMQESIYRPMNQPYEREREYERKKENERNEKIYERENPGKKRPIYRTRKTTEKWRKPVRRKSSMKTERMKEREKTYIWTNSERKEYIEKK